MYLRAKKFYWTTDKNKEEEKKIKAIISEMDVDSFEINDISFEIGYWRKANAIHNWFVEHIQDGKDECETYDVPKDALKELKFQCTQVLLNKNLAPDLLETKDGFFFGAQDYDEWYFKQLQNTIDIIDKALKLSEDWDISYGSSW